MAGLDDHARCAQATRDLFARNLRRLRRGAGLSQEELAERSGLTQSYVSGVEAAKRNPSLDAIGVIAAAMRVPVARLFEEAAAPTPSASTPDPSGGPEGSRESVADPD